MAFQSESVFASLVFYCAAAMLIAQVLSCVLLIMRGLWRQRDLPRRRSKKQAVSGISLLLPLGGSAAQMEKRLQAAFAAEHYGRQELIICPAEQGSAASSAQAGAGAAIIRAVRRRHSEAASLLIALPQGSGGHAQTAHEQTGRARASHDWPGLGADRIAPAVMQGWKAARYDWVAVAAPQIIADKNMLSNLSGRCLQKGENIGLICAAPWGAGGRGAAAAWQAAFLNGFRARRLALADSFGCGVASSAAMLWHYDALNAAGGIRAYAQAARGSSEAEAATQICRNAGQRIKLAFRPQKLDLAAAWAESDASGLGGMSGMGGGFARLKVAALEQVAWLRFYHRFLPHFFYAEPFLGGFLPILAIICLWGGGCVSAALVLAFIAAWYGAELALNLGMAAILAEKKPKGLSLRGLWGEAAGRKLCAAAFACAALPLRDICLPVLGLCALAKPATSARASRSAFIWGILSGLKSRCRALSARLPIHRGKSEFGRRDRANKRYFFG